MRWVCQPEIACPAPQNASDGGRNRTARATVGQGENTVMSLQTARYLVKATELSRNGEPLVGNTRYLEGAAQRLDKEGTAARDGRDGKDGRARPRGTGGTGGQGRSERPPRAWLLPFPAPPLPISCAALPHGLACPCPALALPTRPFLTRAEKRGDASSVRRALGGRVAERRQAAGRVRPPRCAHHLLGGGRLQGPAGRWRRRYPAPAPVLSSSPPSSAAHSRA